MSCHTSFGNDSKSHLSNNIPQGRERVTSCAIPQALFTCRSSTHLSSIKAIAPLTSALGRVAESTREETDLQRVPMLALIPRTGQAWLEINNITTAEYFYLYVVAQALVNRIRLFGLTEFSDTCMSRLGAWLRRLPAEIGCQPVC
jgi:hypothetical protein